jgi:hypothetical protein
MNPKRIRRSVLTVAALGAALTPLVIQAQPAVAVTAIPATFDCRASAFRSPLVPVEPAVANPADAPCTSAKQEISASWGPVGLVGAYAQTAYAPRANWAQSHAQVGEVILKVEGHDIRVYSAWATSNARCNGWNQLPVLDASSEIGTLYVDGTIYRNLSGPQDIGVPGLGVLHVNHESQTGYEVVRRTLWLQAPVLNFVVAEARTTAVCPEIQ